MSELVHRYVIGFLLGLSLGLAYPALASWWLLAYLFAIFAITELIGKTGFGDHWDGYRFSSYLLYSFPCAVASLGILFGSGTIGTFLVATGKLIS